MKKHRNSFHHSDESILPFFIIAKKAPFSSAFQNILLPLSQIKTIAHTA